MSAVLLHYCCCNVRLLRIANVPVQTATKTTNRRTAVLEKLYTKSVVHCDKGGGTRGPAEQHRAASTKNKETTSRAKALRGKSSSEDFLESI